jgi:mRNA interferase RelE/StbE
VVSYRLEIKTSAGKELAEVASKSDRLKIVSRIQAVASNPRPHGSEMLAGYTDRFRIRQGNYRVVYLIDDQSSTVTIYRIGHRKDVYR